MKRAVFVLPLLLVPAGSIKTVNAQPVSNTAYSYYKVSGNNLKEINRSIVHSGPKAGSVKGYAVTTATRGSHMSTASCRKNHGYRMHVNFVIRLPKVAENSALSATDSKAWSKFSRFVKQHEETHRTIWMKCASRFEDQVLAVEGCDSPKVENIWNKMLASCEKPNAQFDRAERNVLKSHSFIKLAKS